MTITYSKLKEKRKEEYVQNEKKFIPDFNGIHYVKPSLYSEKDEPWYKDISEQPTYNEYKDEKRGNYILNHTFKHGDITLDPIKTYSLTEEEKQQRRKKHEVEKKVTEIEQKIYGVLLF